MQRAREGLLGDGKQLEGVCVAHPAAVSTMVVDCAVSMGMRASGHGCVHAHSASIGSPSVTAQC